MPDARASAGALTWKERIRKVRTYGSLKRPALHDRARALLARLNPDALGAAAANPDHSETARQAALDRLAGMGRVPDDGDIRVPGFIKPASADSLRRRLFGWRRGVRVWSGRLTLLLFVVAFGLVGAQLEFEDAALKQGVAAGLITADERLDRGRHLTPAEVENADPDALETFASTSRLENLLKPRVAETRAGRRAKLAEQVGYVAIAAMVVSFLVWFLSSLFRSQPARVLVLRKFNDRKLARSMASLIRDELRPFGHVVTLSDRHFKRSMWEMAGSMVPANFLHAFVIIVWAPLRLIRRQFNRAKNGPAWVGSARDFRNLAHRLRERIGLNFEMMWTSKEIVLVRTSDLWWKRVISMLIASADLILIDLSNVTQGTEWELAHLDALGSFDRAVLVARADRVEEARASLAAYPGARARQLHLYDRSGEIADRPDFVEDMLAALARSISVSRSPK